VTSATGTSVSGYLLGSANTQYTLDFFFSPVSGPAGQGQTALPSLTVMTDGSGLANFNLSGLSIPNGMVVTATATNVASGDTSEFSAGPPVAIQITGGNPQSVTVNTAVAAMRVNVTDAYGNPTPA